MRRSKATNPSGIASTLGRMTGVEGRSLARFEIEHARVCAYMMNGADPASNASASSHRNMNPFSGLEGLGITPIEEM